MKTLLKMDLVNDDREIESSSGVHYQINKRALFVTLGSIVILGIASTALWYAQDRTLRRAAMAQAKASVDVGKKDKAILVLSHFLNAWPEDVPALELMAKLLTEGARSIDELSAAATTQDLLLRLDPMGPDRQENRKLLVDLNLRHGDAIRLASNLKELQTDKFENRYRTAVRIAQQRIAFGADDAESHRLLARALESLSLAGDSKALSDATLEYERALRIDPGDMTSAVSLALINFAKRNDKAGGDEVIEQLIRAKPNSPQIRLVCYRYFLKTGRDERGRAELEAAMKLAPTDFDVRITAAGDALQRNDPVTSTRHLNVLSEQSRSNNRVILLRGQIAILEQHADQAIELWRKSLAESGGKDIELTWRLAHLLIRLGRFAEGRPFLDNYNRLNGDPSNPMSRLLQGLLKEGTGHPSRAIHNLEQARTHIGDGWLVELELGLGRCYEMLNDQTRAVAAYRRAMDFSPWSTTPIRAVARLLRKSHPDEADRLLQVGIQKVPADTSLVADLVSLRVAVQLALPRDSRNWSKVESILKQAENAGHRDLNITKARIDYLALAGRTTESLNLLDQATQGPAAKRVDYWLAWAYQLSALGQVEEATKVLERALKRENAGDGGLLRISQARLMVLCGHTRAARQLLSRNTRSLSLQEQALLAQTLAEICHSMRDHAGVRAACADWARVAPEDPKPGLTLLITAQEGGGEESARLGLSLLKQVDGENEPYALAARALDLLMSNRTREETRSVRFDLAEQLSQQLQATAPQLPIKSLLRGMVLEQNHRIEEAIGEYRQALRGNTAGMALPRLVEILARLKRYDDIALLKLDMSESTSIDQLAANASLKLGDKESAEKLLTNLVQAQPDSLEMNEAYARLLRDLGRPEKAEEALRTLIRRQPNRPDPWLALLGFQVKQKQTSEALNTIEQIVTTYQGPRPDLILARARWVVGDVKEATRLYQAALDHAPNDLGTLRASSEFQEANGRTAQAELLLRRALKLDPQALWARRHLALLLTRRPDPSTWKEAWELTTPSASGSGDLPEDRLLRTTLLERSTEPLRRAEMIPTLIALTEDVPASNPSGLEARSRLARWYLDLGKFAETAKVLDFATDELAEPSPALLALAIEAFARAGQSEDADRRLVRLLAIEPESARSTCARAWAFLARGKKTDALALLEDSAVAAEKSVDGESSALAYLNMLVKLGQPAAIDRVVRRVVARWPNNSALLAQVLIGQNQINEALDACRTSIENGSPREACQVVVNLAIAGRLDEKLNSKARGVVEQALALRPDDVEVLNLVAMLCHFQGRFDDEIKLDQKILVLDPANTYCLNNMAWTLVEFLDRPQEALKKSEEAIRLSGRIPVSCDTRGVILTRLGRYEEAINDLEQSVNGSPSPTRYFHLARAYQKAGQADRYARNRDLALKAGIDPARLDPMDRADFASVMAR